MSRRNLSRFIDEIGTVTWNRVFERFFADIQIQFIKIKRQKPRREEQPGMSENTLSSDYSQIFLNNPG